jgi:hypothetical protein
MQGTLFTNSRVTLGFVAIVIAGALLFAANQEGVAPQRPAQSEEPAKAATKAPPPAAPPTEFASDDDLMADDTGEDAHPDDTADAGDDFASDDTDFGAPQIVSRSASNAHAWSGSSRSSSGSTSTNHGSSGAADSGGANPNMAVVLR